MNTLVITAAGSSTRMGGTVKKEYLNLSPDTGDGVSVLSESLHAFLSTHLFSYIAITIPEKGEAEARSVLRRDPRIAALLSDGKVAFFFVSGGKTRQESVYNGLKAVLARIPPSTAADGTGSENTVLIHDAARPWITGTIIQSVLETVRLHGAAVPAIPPVDTQKEVDQDGKIIRHLDRRSIVAVQTPQGFLLEPLAEAHRKAATDGHEYTDDTEIWGRYAGDVWICPGSRENRKITFAGDIR